MILARRDFLVLGGGVIATLVAPPMVRGEPAITIEMAGSARGERVWFSPLGVAVEPGSIIRFINRDPVNSHTATAYHPDVSGRQKRIPEGAAPWNSGYLLPGETFEAKLTVPGVYDYYCIPHELSGMVGRIVVGSRESDGRQPSAPAMKNMPSEVATRFPPVEDILRKGAIYPDET